MSTPIRRICSGCWACATTGRASSFAAYIEGVPLTVTIVESAGVRTFIVVPMLNEDELIAVVMTFRPAIFDRNILTKQWVTTESDPMLRIVWPRQSNEAAKKGCAPPLPLQELAVAGWLSN